MAVEKVMGIQVPERAQYIRVLMSELQRITSHLILVSSFGLDTGALTPGLYTFRGREKILMFFEAVTGARMMHNYCHIGGVKDDLPEDVDKRLAELLDALKFDIDEANKLFSFNEVFLARARGVGVIDQATAIDFGMTGCALRATGLPYDVRKAQPYSSYEKFDFKVPTGTRGDCWDRYWMRVQELYQSLSIVEQAWKQMPKGPVNAVGRRLIRPPKGEAYVRAENPRGEIGVYLVTDGTDKPYRIKVRPPSYCNLVALSHLLKDQYVADAVLIFGSLDIVLGEVDR
jgi:NADH-quinone oxidoreductase subunit D